MTQQEINQYFISAGYTQTDTNEFVDPTSQFQFLIGEEFTRFLYQDSTPIEVTETDEETEEETTKIVYDSYESVVKNDFVMDADYLANWISNCQLKPQK